MLSLLLQFIHLRGEQLRILEPDILLYERPDGWSRVVAQLARGDIVTIRGQQPEVFDRRRAAEREGRSLDANTIF